MALAFRLVAAEGRFTGRAEGDLGSVGRGNGDGSPRSPAEEEALATRRRAVVDLPWTWLRQVHGAQVVTVERPGAAGGEAADAAVTRTPDAVLAVLTADCAPVALASPEGVVAVAHAGWRGLVAGVLEKTVGAMRALGAGRVEAVLGPCIHAECYAFGPADLDRVAARLGDGVRGRTAGGAPALDLPTAVARALAAVDVPVDLASSACTACTPGWFSHRARGETERQALVLWLPAAA